MRRLVTCGASLFGRAQAAHAATQVAHEVALVGQHHPGEDLLVQVARHLHGGGRPTAPTRPVPDARRRPCGRARACRSRAPRPQRLRRAARRGVQRRPGREPRAAPAPAPCSRRPCVRSIDRLVPPPTSLARLTRTPASAAARQSNRPLPRNRLDDGQKAICAPAVAQRGAVVVVEPDAVRQHARGCSRPARGIDVEIAARLREQLGAPSAPRRGSRRRGSACTGSASARHSAPAIASCCGVLVGAKRTVTA